jgi:hypothetical protein
MTDKYLETLEESAFYESGLSADGCLEKLDSYALEAIVKYGRFLLEKHNNASELRVKLAESLVKNDELKKLARKLYGTVLHVYELAKVDPLVVIGPALYKEAAEGAKEYEGFESNS